MAKDIREEIMPKTALQLYSIKEIAEQDFYHALHIAKQIGYDGVEFAGFFGKEAIETKKYIDCLLYTSPSPRDRTRSRMPSSA